MITNQLCFRLHVHHSRKLIRRGGNRTFRRSLSCSDLTTLNAPHSGRSSLVIIASNVTQSDAPQRSEEWFALRKDKLTTSTFSTALGFWKGNRRVELWQEKVFSREISTPDASQSSAMEWGVEHESAAIEQYKTITGLEVNSMGFVIHSQQHLGWLGASPDGLLDCLPMGGILEVKCPYNKGKPETALPWSTMPYYYMPQVQGQLEIMDREWADLYCWTQNGSTIIRVHRDRHYWHLIHAVLREFWWENVVPAREALLLGMEDEARRFQPTTKHRQTGLVVSQSIKLASDSKLTCREIAGHVQFFR